MGLMVIFANGKGGVGKTTLACSYAVLCARAGMTVMIADINDEQHSAAIWAQTRAQNGHKPDIPVEVMAPRNITDALNRTDMLIVDTPSWTRRNTVAMARAATYICIPTGPNVSMEIGETLALAHDLTAAGVRPWQFGIVLNRFDSESTTEELIARHVLTQSGYPALDGALKYKISFNSAFAEGRALMETRFPSLNAEANRLLDVISRGVTGAVRSLAREQKRAQARDLPHHKEKL